MLKILILLAFGAVTSSVAFLLSWVLNGPLYNLGWHADKLNMAGIALLIIFAIDLIVLFFAPSVFKGLTISFPDYALLVAGFVFGGLVVVCLIIFVAIQLANVT